MIDSFRGGPNLRRHSESGARTHAHYKALRAIQNGRRSENTYKVCRVIELHFARRFQFFQVASPRRRS